MEREQKICFVKAMNWPAANAGALLHKHECIHAKVMYSARCFLVSVVYIKGMFSPVIRVRV